MRSALASSALRGHAQAQTSEPARTQLTDKESELLLIDRDGEIRARKPCRQVPY